jgi:hypothetical protein
MEQNIPWVGIIYHRWQESDSTLSCPQKVKFKKHLRKKNANVSLFWKSFVSLHSRLAKTIGKTI